MILPYMHQMLGRGPLKEIIMKLLLIKSFVLLMFLSQISLSDNRVILNSKNPTFEKPTVLTAGQQAPVNSPKDYHRIAVMNVTLIPDDKQVRAKVNSTKLVKGFAPKVFTKSGGTWKVKIVGDKTVSYTLNNPYHDIEIEKDPNKGTFKLVEMDSPLEWTFVVPLYKEGKPIGAKSIEIWDLVSKRKVIETSI